MTKAKRVVLSGGKFVIARKMADAGIPFVFVKEAGNNTVGDVPNQFVSMLSNWLDEHPEIEGRFARAATKHNPRAALLAAHAAAITPKARKRARKNPVKHKAASKHRILVQAEVGNGSGIWATISAYSDTDTGKASAIAEAKKIHGKIGNQSVRVWRT